MFVNVQRLKGQIVEKSNTQECVADAMGMNHSTFYRKMKNGGNGFTVGDIHKMMVCIPFTKEEAVDIFLINKSHYCDIKGGEKKMNKKKVETLTVDIVRQCEQQGFTVEEAQLFPSLFQSAVKHSVKKLKIQPQDIAENKRVTALSIKGTISGCHF